MADSDSAPPKTYYIIPTHEPERERLSRQHYFLKRVFDNKIVWAPVDLNSESDLFVLDSGTAGGAWLLDISTHCPPSSTWILDGIDTSSSLFPSSHPPNISFYPYSVLELPSSWTNRFNLTHQRLFRASLLKADWPKGIAELHRVLKPGGYIQIAEMGAWEAGTVTEKFTAFWHEFYDFQGFDMDCVPNMPGYLEQAGFVDIKEEKRRIPLNGQGSSEKEARENLITVYRSVKPHVVKTDGLGILDVTDYDGFMDDVKKEWEETLTSGYWHHIFVAKKPE